MGILNKIKKTFRMKNKFLYKLSKYKLKKYDSVKEYPSKLSSFINKGNIGCNFLITLYKCPCCRANPLYKTMFPIGKEYKITSVLGFIYMDEVYTCPNCYRVFTPLQDEEVDYEEMFTLKLDNEKEYIDYLLPLNIFGLIKEEI